MMICLADAKHRWPLEEFAPLPSGFAPINGVFVMNDYAPSVLLTSMDFIISGWHLNTSIFSACSPKELDQQIPNEEIKYDMEIIDLFQHPYFSPMYYEHFERLKDVKL